MPDGQLVGIRKNIGGNAALPQRVMKPNHGLNGNKNVAEKRGEFLERAAEAGGSADLLVETLLVQESGFKAEQQRRVIDKCPNLIGRHFALQCNPAGSDRVIEINQDFAEIENDDF